MLAWGPGYPVNGITSVWFRRKVPVRDEGLQKPEPKSAFCFSRTLFYGRIKGEIDSLVTFLET